MSAPEHSPIGPSGAGCWSSCTASVYFTWLMARLKEAPKDKEIHKRVKQFLPTQDIKQLVAAAKTWIENPTSVYAEEGTIAHTWAEKVLNGQVKIEDVPEEFKCVQVFTDICNTLKKRWGGKAFVECKTPLFYYPQHNGTTDWAMAAPTAGGDMIFVNDYKHGQGVLVAADDNKQLTAYALSFLKKFEEVLDINPDTKVEIRIVQPRTRGDEYEKVWQTTVGELEVIGADLQEKADLIMGVINEGKDPSVLEFVPGEKECKFCPMKDLCGARKAEAFAPLTVVDADMLLDSLVDEKKGLAAIPIVTPEQLVSLVRNKKAIEAILEGAQQYLLQLAIQGEPAPGTKLVEGRQGDRKWRDPEEVKNRLLALRTADSKDTLLKRADIIEEKMLGIAPIEKLLKGKVDKEVLKELDAMTTRAPGKPTLAMENDKRPALASSVDLLDLIADPEDHAD